MPGALYRQPPVTHVTPPPIDYKSRAPAPPDGAVDLTVLVPGDGPLEIDIGFGRGRSFLERARANVSRVIGIEIKAKWSFLVEQRRVEQQLLNAVAFWADAKELLARSGPDASVQRAFVHFPDPWWKKRHGKRRVVSDEFLVTLARLIRVGGELYVQTDVPDRADEYESLLRDSGVFEPRRIDANPFSRSNREVRAEEDSLPIHRLLATRVKR